MLLKFVVSVLRKDIRLSFVVFLWTCLTLYAPPPMPLHELADPHGKHSRVKMMNFQVFQLVPYKELKCAVTKKRVMERSELKKILNITKRRVDAHMRWFFRQYLKAMFRKMETETLFFTFLHHRMRT